MIGDLIRMRNFKLVFFYIYFGTVLPISVISWDNRKLNLFPRIWSFLLNLTSPKHNHIITDFVMLSNFRFQVDFS